MFEIIAEAGAGYTAQMIYDHHERKWLDVRTYRGDGTGTDIDTREIAEQIMAGLQPDSDLRNIRSHEVGVWKANQLY